MSIRDTDDTPRRWPAQPWVGIAVAVATALLVAVPVSLDARSSVSLTLLMFTPLAGVVGMVVWWRWFSRTPSPANWVALALFALPAAAFAAVEVLVEHQPPMKLYVYGLTFVLLVWGAWLVIGPALSPGVRRGGLYVSLALAWLAFGVVRIDGTDGSMRPQLTWRWNPSQEDLNLPDIQHRERVTAVAWAGDVAETPGDWPGFRGPNRDNVVTGTNIDTDWAAHPPTPVWEKKVGPGWGSFAVVGDRLFTQEQQGKSEAITCLDAATGNLVWDFTYPAVFRETISGVGPRGTPTVKNGQVFAYGGTGQLTCLKASDGTKVWQVDVPRTVGTEPPKMFWGYASSPLVTRGLAIVYSGGADGKGTSAFSATDGALVWSSGKASHAYGSAQLVTIAGVEQVLMESNYGLEAFDPATGKLLWEHEWFIPQNRSLQPVVLGEGDFLIGTGIGTLAARRVKVTKASDGSWLVEKAWETAKLSPYFNDGVAYKGHYYGFSGKNFVCVDGATGEQKWEAGAIYGNGQVLLLADQGLLLVSGEDGKMHLLRATPEDHDEIGVFKTIPGKMWNHPVVAHGRLYVRNGNAAACYELARK